jgi:hypothetical protein
LAARVAVLGEADLEAGVVSEEAGVVSGAGWEAEPSAGAAIAPR